MVKKVMYQQIQQMKRQGASKSKISRLLKLDRKTVRKYFDMSESEFLEYRLSHTYRDKVLAPYKEEIVELYKKNGNRRLNMAAVFDYLEERHQRLDCTEKSLRNYIAFLIETGELTLSIKQRVYEKVPQMPYGKQVQLDFGVYKAGNGLTIHIFAALLSASRFKYVAVQEQPFTTESTILHLLDAFDYFGGQPEELAIDQDRVMVVSENYGDILYTKDFRYFIDEMSLKMYVCRKADPESKGKVENLVKYVKYNFFNVREFSSIAEAKESLSSWLPRRANGKLSQATGRIPGEEILEERKFLNPLRNSIFRKESLTEREERLVSESSLISFRASQYSVPLAYRKKKVDIYTASGNLYIFDSLSGKVITEHPLASIPGSKVVNRDHLREKARKLRELKEEVRAMFALESWQSFTGYNFKAFPRYVRDQCSEARRQFSPQKMKLAILEKALLFCLENRSYSFSNLNDTYRYFLNEERRWGGAKIPVLPELKGERLKKQITVSRRDLTEYQTLMTAGARGQK